MCNKIAPFGNLERQHYVYFWDIIQVSQTLQGYNVTRKIYLKQRSPDLFRMPQGIISSIDGRALQNRLKLKKLDYLSTDIFQLQ